MDIFEEILRLKHAGRPAALCTIVQARGSSPQKEGVKMLVRDDGTIFGTLGGGCLEAAVITEARMVMTDGGPRTIPFNLTEKEGGLVCGGTLLVFVEPILAEPHLVVLGAGHVGRALAKAARFTGFRVTVSDDRAEHASQDNLPDASAISVGDFGTVFTRVAVDSNTFIVIATRGHNHDLDALKAALATDAAYIGMLGSRRKRAVLFKALKDEGFEASTLERVVVPVGLDIGSVTPEEIAISIVAQLIVQRRKHAERRNGHPSCGGVVAEDGAVEAPPSSRR